MCTLTVDTLKEKLVRGETAIGTIVTFPTPEVVEIFATAGFDFVQIECEHAPLSLREVQNLLQVAEGKIPAAVRVPVNDAVQFKLVLDVGARNVVVPMVNCEEDARKAVAACRYPPNGIRGFGPRRASNYTASTDSYFRKFEQELGIIPIIESVDAVANIDSILAVDGITSLLIGPADLSISLGAPFDFSCEKYQAALRSVLKAAERADKPPGIGVSDPSQIRALRDQGFRLFLTGGDYYFVVERCREVMQLIDG